VWLEPPLDLWIAAESAGAGARRVDQYAVELAAKRQRLGAIQDDQRAIEIAQLFQAVPVNITGYGADALLDSLRGFIAGRGAEVEERLTRAKVEQRNDGLRADILDAAGACDVALSGLKKRGGDSIGCLASELRIPLVEQPSRHGKRGWAIGPGDRLAIRFTQNCVDEACCRRSAKTLHQLDALADGGMRRDAIEIAQLIDSHAERDANFGFRGTWDAARDQVIELGLEAEASEDDFRSEAGVARIEMR